MGESYHTLVYFTNKNADIETHPVVFTVALLTLDTGIRKSEKVSVATTANLPSL